MVSLNIYILGGHVELRVLLPDGPVHKICLYPSLHIQNPNLNNN